MERTFLEILDSAARKVRDRIGLSRLLAAATLAFAGIAIGAWFDSRCRFLTPSERWMVLVLSLAFAALAGGSAFLLARNRWARRTVARSLENHGDRELFLTSLEAVGGSVSSAKADEELHRDFRRLLLSRAASRLSQIDLRPVIARRRLAAPAAMFGATTAAIFTGALVSGEFRVGLARILAPWLTITHTRIVAFDAPDDAMPGQTVPVAVILGGRPVDRVELEVVTSRKQVTRVTMSLEDGRWVANLPAMQDDVVLRVNAGDSEPAERCVACRIRQIRNAIHWPDAFGRPDTLVDRFAAVFPEKSSFVWRLRLAPNCTGAKVELRRKGTEEISTLAMTPDAEGFFSTTRSFADAGELEARISVASSGSDRRETRSSWTVLECRKDLPPVVKLSKPEGPEFAVSRMAPLEGAYEARDDWGLRKTGIGMMVGDKTSEEEVVEFDGVTLDVAKVVKLLLSRHPGLSPESSVMLWAFAVDAGGQRTLSMPVALDVQELFERQDGQPPAPPMPPGEDGPDLDELIRLQRQLTGKTLAAPTVTQELSKEQQSVIDKIKAAGNGASEGPYAVSFVPIARSQAQDTPGFGGDDEVNIEISAAMADMDAARLHLDCGEKDHALASQQSALGHLLKAKAKKKQQSSKSESKDKKKPEQKLASLADALDEWAKSQDSLADRIDGDSPSKEDSAEHHHLTKLLDEIAAGADVDEKLAAERREDFRGLKEHARLADAKIAEGNAPSAGLVRAAAAEAHVLAAALRTQDNLALAQQLEQMRRELEQAADQLDNGANSGEQKPSGSQQGGGKESGGKDGKDGEDGKGDSKGKRSKDADSKARADAGRRIATVEKQMGAVLSSSRDDLNELHRILDQAKAGSELERLAANVTRADSKKTDAKNAADLRAVADSMGEASEAVRQGEAARMAKALGMLDKLSKTGDGQGKDEGQGQGQQPGNGTGQGGQPGNGPSSGQRSNFGEAMRDLAAVMSDMKDASLRSEAGKITEMVKQRPTFSPEELAALRGLLLEALREQRLAGLNGAKDAPIPGESAPVSEAYLRALSDDLDVDAEKCAR